MPQPRKYENAAERQRAYLARREQTRCQQLQAKGLPALPTMATMPGERRWQGLLESARITLQTLHQEMQAYQEQRSEAWQESDRGQAMAERIELLEALIADVEDLSAR
jgi:hypothetical protein